MAVLRNLSLIGISLVAVFAACSDDDDSSSNGTPSSASVSTSASAGGATASSSSSSSGTGGCGQTTGLDLMCTSPVLTNATMTACNVLNQDCPAGQWCDVINGSTTCVPDQGGVKCQGQTCVTDSDCRAGLKCIGSQGNARCTPFCCAGTSEPCEAGLCNLDVMYPGDVIGRMCSYPPQCDLLADNCPMGQSCYPIDPSQGQAACYPQQSPPSGEGEECAALNDCSESSYCFDDDNNGTTPIVCRQLCDLDNWMNEVVPTGGCPTDRTCVPVPLFAGTVWADEIGACLP